MTKISPAPITHPITDETTRVTIPWSLFFTSLFTGDTGTSWTPTFTSLTSVGTPTITGKYFRIGQFYYFWVKIVPGTNTSSTFGTTYINNLPFTVVSDGACQAVNDAPSVAQGVVLASNNRAYTPSWTTRTNTITITGFVEAR